MRVDQKQSQEFDDWYFELKAGDYGKDLEGNVFVRPTGKCTPVNISKWTIVEHEDRTITADPSININGVWHGYLKHGIFQKC